MSADVPVIHIRDVDGSYNSAPGDWAVCGEPWPAEGQEEIWPSAPLCEACVSKTSPVLMERLTGSG